MPRSDGLLSKVTQWLFLIGYSVPIAWIIITSLKVPEDVFSKQRAFIFTPTFDAYIDAIVGDDLLPAALRSFLIATGTTGLTVALAIPAGYGLARVGGRLTTIVLSTLVIFQMLPQTASLIPLFQIFASWGVLNSLGTLILANSALFLPFAILLIRPFFRSVPVAVEEAAGIDGANRLQIFWLIAVPIARNGVFTTATLIYMISWGEFLYAVNFMISGNNYPLSALLASQVSGFGIDWPGLMALAVLTSVPILILFTITYRLLRDGLTIGAVK